MAGFALERDGRVKEWRASAGKVRVNWSQFSCKDSPTDSLVSVFGNKDPSSTVVGLVGLASLGGWVGQLLGQDG